MAIELKVKEKEKRVPFQFNLPESVEKRFREYVYHKHNGYRKGLFSAELEIALNDLMQKFEAEK